MTKREIVEVSVLGGLTGMLMVTADELLEGLAEVETEAGKHWAEEIKAVLRGAVTGLDQVTDNMAKTVREAIE